MQFKPVPEAPADLDELERVRQAVPREVGSDVDCCGRLVSTVDWIRDRDDAAEWLVMLRALGLAEAVDGGYVRTGGERTAAVLADRFRERVLGADDVVATLGDESRSVEQVRDRSGRSERGRASARDVGSDDRVQRLLDWAVVFGLATRSDGGYRRS